jgi:DNA-binding NarL/FixJ family response regulator
MARILLADDHQIVRDGIRRYLEDDQDLCVIAEAENGTDTVQLVREHQPDLVVMDISMPGLNGIEATRKIIADFPWIRVIGLSQHTELRFVSEMMRVGASGYLPKKCAARELVQAVHAVLSGGIYLSPEIAGAVVGDYLQNREPDQGTVFNQLSPREREVLQLISEGHSMKEIAAQLHVSHRTANTHREHIMEKLAIDNLADLVKYAIREGITEP